ncbi:hypothetical protein [Deinococcus hohokamensis]|uniref:Uncharacterized protein n=1 Tax=Deinococcus hohokamensis TaxID=309883 RepID=A0ABV9IBF1_9DEIO
MGRKQGFWGTLGRFRLRWPPVWWPPAGPPGPPAALTHLAELHDVFTPEDARQAAARTRRDPFLATDLRRPRPAWRPEETTGELLQRLWQTEGPGLLARLGEAGPWVYVADVAALQDLGRAYEALVHEVWTVGRSTAGAGDALVARLALHLATVEGGTDQPYPAEETFWTLAAEVARQRRAARAAGVWP